MIDLGLYIKWVNFSNIVHDELVIGYIDNKIETKENVGIYLEKAMSKAGRIFAKKVPHIGKAEIIKGWAH